MWSAVTSGDTVKGYRHPLLSLKDRTGVQFHPEYFYFILLVILGLSLIPVLGFWFLVSRPLDQLIYAAGEYAAGNLITGSSKSPADELEYLGASLSSRRPGRKKEAKTRKFISNISHDFPFP